MTETDTDTDTDTDADTGSETAAEADLGADTEPEAVVEAEAETVELDPSADPATAGDGEAGEGSMSVEELIADLERVTAERDQYLDTSRRVQAEFENYRKQVAKREADARDRANESMVNAMLPVLDAFDGAVSSGIEDVAPMQAALLDSLVKQGLERIDPVETDEGPAPFDPNLHEAVMHEPAADGAHDAAGPVVAEVLRAGYSWRERVIRPAMVRTRGGA